VPKVPTGHAPQASTGEVLGIQIADVEQIYVMGDLGHCALLRRADQAPARCWHGGSERIYPSHKAANAARPKGRLQSHAPILVRTLPPFPATPPGRSQSPGAATLAGCCAAAGS